MISTRAWRAARRGRLLMRPRPRQRLAITAVYDGPKRAQAAEIGGMGRQTPRDWVHPFNEAVWSIAPRQARLRS